MALQDLTPARLAALPGMKPFSNRRITNLLCGQDESWPIRSAINRALRHTIFTKPTAVHSRNPPKTTP